MITNDMKIKNHQFKNEKPPLLHQDGKSEVWDN